MAIDKGNFSIISLSVPIDSSKVDSIKIEIAAENVLIDGALYVTDVMFQGGGVATSHELTPSEIKWSFDNV